MVIEERVTEGQEVAKREWGGKRGSRERPVERGGYGRWHCTGQNCKEKEGGRNRAQMHTEHPIVKDSSVTGDPL
jgi:hypothetical protein